MRAFTRRAALGALAAAAYAPVSFAASLGPVVRETDAALRIPALHKVRAALLAGVRSRDVDRIRPHVDPGILVVFGGENGVAALFARLRREPWLWEELAWVLAHGGRMLDGEFWAPYVFQAEVGAIDPHEAGVVVAANVPARAAPRSDAAILVRLDRHAVRIVADGGAGGAPRPFYKRRDWLKIALPGIGEAWVEARSVRRMDDYRAGFARRGAGWKLTAFVSGD